MVVCVWSNYCHASALTLSPPAIVRLTLSSLWAHSSVSVLIGEEKAWGTLCGLSDTKIQQWGITCQYSYWVWAPQEWKNSFHLKCWIIINLTASMNEMNSTFNQCSALHLSSSKQEDSQILTQTQEPSQLEQIQTFIRESLIFLLKMHLFFCQDLTISGEWKRWVIH